jgi:hypothetical protein
MGNKDYFLGANDSELQRLQFQHNVWKEITHKFFSTHIQHMADKKIISQKEANEMLEDWMEHRNNPDAIFFSPIVVDAAGRK